MIIKPDKSYETNSLFPSTDWYNEGNYVIDETTPEGKGLADKVMEYYPHYNLVLSENNEVVDVVFDQESYEQAEYQKQLFKVKQKRDELLQMTDWIVIRHRGQLDRGIDTTLTPEEYHGWLDYRQVLRDLPNQAGFDPFNVEWPTPPQTLD